MSIKEQIDLQRLPAHIAIIMDGNGRWAKQKGEQRAYGHECGVESVREVAEACAELGVKFLTLYAFSTENWNRPQHEINAILGILIRSLRSELKTLEENNIRLHAIGDTDSLGKEINAELRYCIDATSKNSRMTMILALSYSSRWEIIEAAKKFARQVSISGLDPNSLSAGQFSELMCTKGIPDPELLIRTSGEFRVSNFLLWQIAYTELYFTPKLWPDFRKEDLFEAIVNFQNRERRFGMISEQFNA